MYLKICNQLNTVLNIRQKFSLEMAKFGSKYVGEYR